MTGENGGSSFGCTAHHDGQQPQGAILMSFSLVPHAASADCEGRKCGRVSRHCLAVGSILATIAITNLLGSSAPAGAQLPGAGYTFDSHWNCGPIYGGYSQTCYEDSTASNPCLGRSCAHNHTFGWGSADYDGGGSTTVLIEATCSSSGGCANIPAFLDTGRNLARACYQLGCDDQDRFTYKMFVAHADPGGSNIRHTIKGHGKA